jgi:glycosyltransferase involved in cell wall biosynthesis
MSTTDNSSDVPRLMVDCRKAWDAGIGTYIRHVIPGVLRRLPPFVSVRVLVAPGTVAQHGYLDSLPVEFIEDAGFPLSLSEQWYLRQHLLDGEIFWATSLAHPLLGRGPLMATVYDVAQLALDSRSAGGRFVQCAARLYLESLRRRAGQLLFISEFTASEFKRHVGPARGLTHVAPLGVDADWFEAYAPVSLGIRPYFISVGSIRPHKNLRTLLAAFRQVLDQLPHDLVIVGKHEGFRTRESGFEELLAPLGERVRFLGGVDDATLRQQVAGATALIFPSLYEGFGLPPVEAMAAGCPVIASRAGAVVEVCGDAARYFETSSADSLAAALLEQAGISTENRLAQVLRGRDWARQYSWERTADLTAQALRARFGLDQFFVHGAAHG